MNSDSDYRVGSGVQTGSGGSTEPEFYLPSDEVASDVEPARVSFLLRQHIYEDEPFDVNIDLAIMKQQAQELVNDVLNSAIQMCMIFFGMEPPPPSTLCVFDPEIPEDVAPDADKNKTALVVNHATRQLNRFMRSWMQRVLRLQCYIHLFRHWQNDSDGTTTYIIEAVFSGPTPQCPTPQCTASVYFMFTVPPINRLSSKPLFVPYHYQFEGLTYMHDPSVYGQQFDFQENRILVILEEKLKLYRRLHF